MRLQVLLFLSCILTNLSILGRINQKHDKQVWLSSGIYGKFSEDFTTNFRQEFRWGNNGGRLYFQLTQLTLDYKITNAISVSGGYRNVTRLASTQTRNWFQGYAALGRITFSASKEGWKLSDRNWVQREWIPSGAILDFWLYRNRLTMDTPLYFLTKKMPIYLYDEVFFRQRSGFFENRFAGGVKLNWTEYTTGYIEGMYRRLETNRGWVPETVFNFNLSFRF